MAKETDNQLVEIYRKGLIARHMTVDTCKECQSLQMIDVGPTCTQVSPSPINCILVKQLLSD